MALKGDRWLKIISTHGNIRGVGIQATQLVQEMARLHELKGSAARGLGEVVMGALTISSFCKAGERINLNIRGSKLFRQALVDAYPDGTVRGYISEREAMAQSLAGLEMGPWGEGILSVLRTKHTEGQQPYIGSVPLVTGHLAKDLTFYWHQSEQIPSAVGLVVNLEKDQVTAAGGFLIQILPGASAAEVRQIEQHIQGLDSLAGLMANDQDPLHLLSQIFQSTAFMLLEEKPLQMKCTCSWERVERALALVGVAELQQMLDQDNQAVVRCDFCTQEYKVSAEGLKKLISGVGTKARN